MIKLFKRIKEEAINAIPAAIFFLISFNLINFTERLMLKPEELNSLYFSFLTTSIAALIVCKIVIIANTLPFINAFPHRPLIYNMMWKFFIYGSLAVLVRMADKCLHLFLKYKTLPLTMTHLAHALKAPLFWAIVMWILMLFAIYIFNSEFIRAIGKRKTSKMVFG